jgi:hypothetical protein
MELRLERPCQDPTFIPIELVERLVGPLGAAAMVTAQARGARFQPHATLHTRIDRFVAEIDFVAPLGPERQCGLVVMLGVKPRRAIESPSAGEA